MLRLEINIRGNVDHHGGREGRAEIEKLKRKLKEHFKSSRVSIVIVAETCDVCGRWVNMRDDPIFKEHNEKFYEEHVGIPKT